MFFNEYPYLNLNDLNLDFIYRELKRVRKTLDDYVSRSTITFHDPITWDITDQYTVNTMVVDSDGTAYLSVQPVPAGVDITNTDYWQPIFNYDDSLNKLISGITVNTRTTGVLPAAVDVGMIVWFNGSFYRTTSALAAGSVIIPGTNAEEITFAEWVKGLIGALDTVIGALTDRITDEETARADADAALGDRITDEATARANADTALNDRIDSIAGIGGFKEQFSNKRIAIVGDSLSVDSLNTWARSFANICTEINSTVTNFSVNGATTASALAALQGNTDIFDVAIIWLGINDAGNHVPVGNVGTAGSFSQNYKNIIDNLYARNNDVSIFALSVSFWKNGQYSPSYSPLFYSAAIRNICMTRGCAFKDMSALQRASIFYGSAQYPDGVHFLPAYFNTNILFTIINKMLTCDSEQFSYTLTLNRNNFTAGENVTLNSIDGYYTIGGNIHMTVNVSINAALTSNAPILTVPSTMYPFDNIYTLVFSALYTPEYWFISNTGVIQCNASVPIGRYTIVLDYCPLIANASTFST